MGELAFWVLVALCLMFACWMQDRQEEPEDLEEFTITEYREESDE